MIETIIFIIIILITAGAVHFKLKKILQKLPATTQNIVMLGPRGVGKTTVLGGIADEFKKIAAGENVKKEWVDFKDLRLLHKDAKTITMIQDHALTMKDVQERARKFTFNSEGLKVPMKPLSMEPNFAPTGNILPYEFELTAKDRDPSQKSTFTLNFYDVPGGTLFSSLATPEERGENVRLLKDAGIVVLVVDAPYLMEPRCADLGPQCSGDVEGRRNNARGVASVLREARPFEASPGLLLIVPCRCERYLNDGRGKDLLEAIEKEFASVIQMFRQSPYTGRVKIAITPVKTVGFIQFDSFSSQTYEDAEFAGIRLPIFWPVGEVAERSYRPEHLEQPVWHILLHCIQAAVGNHSSKEAEKLRRVLNELKSSLRKTDGFKVMDI